MFPLFTRDLANRSQIFACLVKLQSAVLNGVARRKGKRTSWQIVWFLAGISKRCTKTLTINFSFNVTTSFNLEPSYDVCTKNHFAHFLNYDTGLIFPQYIKHSARNTEGVVKAL